MAIGHDQIHNRFGYHRANETTGPQHAAIRARYESMALWLDEVLPDGRDKSEALTDLQKSMHWANSAVAMTTPVDEDPATPTP